MLNDIYGWTKYEFSCATQPGKSLYRGKVHYHLCSCQSTISLAVGKEKNKSCFFQNNLLKSRLTTVQAVVHLPPVKRFPSPNYALAEDPNFSNEKNLSSIKNNILKFGAICYCTQRQGHRDRHPVSWKLNFQISTLIF